MQVISSCSVSTLAPNLHSHAVPLRLSVCPRIILKVARSSLLYSLAFAVIGAVTLSQARPYCEVDSGPQGGERQQGSPAATTHVCCRWALYTIKWVSLVACCCFCTGSSGMGAPSSRQQQGTKQVSQSGSNQDAGLLSTSITVPFSKFNTSVHVTKPTK